ncbi:MAG: hypothetical protein ACR2RV_05700 [Verrucomicrobiales bacterium]
MNALGFTIRRIARSFGIKNEMNRRMAVTREMQLLAEAESSLGRAAWSDAENIEEVTEEFYQIRSLKDEVTTIKEEIRSFERENQRLRARQEDLELKLDGKIDDLIASKSKEMQRTVALIKEVEHLRTDAEMTRKKYSGVRLRLRSLLESNAPEKELAAERNSLTRLKQEYASETKQILEQQAEVKRSDAEIVRLEDQIASTRASARAEISTIMGEVGRSSNLLARYTAKLGAIEKSIADLTFSIGTYLSQNSDNPTPEIQQVINKHRSIISRLSALKSSIRFNRILSGQRG